MSKSKTITLTGSAYWAKVFPENKDATGYDDQLTELGGQYVIDMDLDDDSIVSLSESKSQAIDYPKEGKNNEDDKITVYRFKRLHEKRQRDGTLLEWASGAPEVLDEMGQPWVLDDRGLIGNGSKVKLTVSVYEAGRLVGTRLEKVQVLDHVVVPEKESA